MAMYLIKNGLALIHGGKRHEGTTIYGHGRASRGSVGVGQTIGGVSGRVSLNAESDQLGNHGSPASLPRRLSQMFPRTCKINPRT